MDQFEPDGAFVRAFGWGVVPGAASGTGDLTAGTNAIVNVKTATGSFNTGIFGAGKVITGPGIPADDVIERVTASEILLTKPVSSSGTVPLSVAAGPGNIPTNERQQIAIRATGGTYVLSFRSPMPDSTIETTAPIAYNASAADLQSALEALSSIGSGSVSVSGGPGDSTASSPYTVTFQGRFADTNVRELTAANVALTGSSSGVVIATPQEGAGTVETCTTVCLGASAEEGSGERGKGVGGSAPGQLSFSESIAADNSCAQQEPRLTGAACEAFDPSYGDVYVFDQQNLRVEKYAPDGRFLLELGGEVDKTTKANVCTATDMELGDTCGAGSPGAGHGQFSSGPQPQIYPGDSSIAVGPNGTVYVGDYGRIQEFEPDGTFAGELPLADAEPQFVVALAVDGAGDIFERSATYAPNGELESQVSGVREYGPAHSLTRVFDTAAGSQPTKLALDRAGDLFVSDFNGGDFQFRAFKPDGSLYAVLTSDQVEARSIDAVKGLAIGDPAGKLYATVFRPDYPHVAVVPLPEPGPPIVKEPRAPEDEIGPITATIRALVNPDGFPTEYHVEYVTQAHYEAEGFENAEATLPADAGLIIRDEPVAVPLSGLRPGTAYRFRAVAVNHCHESSEECTAFSEAASFTTLPPVSVRDFTTQVVGPELVELKAQINPNHSLAPAHYKICYGPATGEYSGGCSENELHGGSGEFEAVRATFNGLQPNTSYHYQLTAENEYGEVKTTDRVFTTEETVAEENARAACPNQIRREENSSLALSDCRAYEQVSPQDKAGYPTLSTSELAPSGERIGFFSIGSFAGNAVVSKTPPRYLAHRSLAGWLTEPTLAYPAGPDNQPLNWQEFDAELNSWLFTVAHGSDLWTTVEQTPLLSYYRGSPGGGFAPMTPILSAALRPASRDADNGWVRLLASSSDFSRLFFGTQWPVLESDPRPGLPINASDDNFDRIYEAVASPGVAPTISLVAEVPLGLPTTSDNRITECFLDFRNTVGQRTLWSSASGRDLFFTAPIERLAGTGCGEGNPNPFGLFARIDGQPPIQLNAPPASECSQPSSCASATPTTPRFYGASPDGRFVWFTTAQPLVNGDSDTTGDLYLAEIQSDQVSRLIQVSAGVATTSHPNPGTGARVQGALQVSSDGTHVAFVATGVLTDSPNSLNETAAPGADNLYAYDIETETLKFVTRLCTGDGESGSNADSACPPGSEDQLAWLETPLRPSSVHFTPNGKVMLLTSWGRLTPDDTDGAVDLFRYDFATGQLTRLSFGHDGNDGNGNDNAYPVLTKQAKEVFPEQQDGAASDGERYLSADGSRAIFETAAPLVASDTNGAVDIYEWEEQGIGSCNEAAGCIHLISDGTNPHGAQYAVISSSGRDIAFFTSSGLVPGDADGIGDIYDARENGGFPYSPPQITCASGETCLPRPTPPPPSPNFTTEGNVSGGNGIGRRRCAKGKVRVRRHGQIRCVKKHRRRHLSRTTKGGTK